MDLRHPATGAQFGPDIQRFELYDGTMLQPFIIPSIGDRPLPHMEVVTAPGEGEREPPIGVMDAYDYVIASVEDRGMTGSAVLSAKRWHAVDGGEVRWVNLTIPDDPWPESFGLAISWTCGA